MRQRLRDIAKITCGHVSPSAIATYIGVTCIALMLGLCAIPVQPGWSGGDMVFCSAVPFVAAAGMAVCILNGADIRISALDVLVVILYGYFNIRYYADSTYPADGMAIQAGLAAALYLAMRMLFSGIRLGGNAVAVIILLFAVYETFLGIFQLLSAASRHYRYPVTGTFCNPGPYSACLVMGLVIICAYLKYPDTAVFFKMQKKVGSAVSAVMQSIAIVLVSVMIITMSRTAFLSAALCLLLLYRDRIGNLKWLLIAACIAAGIGLYFMKSGSADGRFAINSVGFLAVADSPLFGSGAGSFFHKFAQATEMLSAGGSKIDLGAVDVIEYAFNDWLLIAVELGFAGMAVAVAIAALVLRNLWRSSRPLFLSFLTILVFSLFSYPMEQLPYRIITVIIISFAASQSQGIFPRLAGRRASIAVMAVVALAISGIFIKDGKRVKSLADAENDYNMMRGIDDPALIKDYAPLLPLLEGNRNFLFDYARMLAKARRYNDSNHMLRKGALISNDPMFLVLQGNNYRDMGAFEEAEEMYLKAWHTMPNRIYPFYRLMKLHQLAGNSARSSAYAEKVLDFKEKIPSPAVEEMKKEAQDIINH